MDRLRALFLVTVSPTLLAGAFALAAGSLQGSGVFLAELAAFLAYLALRRRLRRLVLSPRHAYEVIACIGFLGAASAAFVLAATQTNFFELFMNRAPPPLGSVEIAVIGWSLLAGLVGLAGGLAGARASPQPPEGPAPPAASPHASRSRLLWRIALSPIPVSLAYVLAMRLASGNAGLGDAGAGAVLAGLLFYIFSPRAARRTRFVPCARNRYAYAAAVGFGWLVAALMFQLPLLLGRGLPPDAGTALGLLPFAWMLAAGAVALAGGAAGYVKTRRI